MLTETKIKNNEKRLWCNQLLLEMVYNTAREKHSFFSVLHVEWAVKIARLFFFFFRATHSRFEPMNGNEAHY